MYHRLYLKWYGTSSNFYIKQFTNIRAFNRIISKVSRSFSILLLNEFFNSEDDLRAVWPSTKYPCRKTFSLYGENLRYIDDCPLISFQSRWTPLQLFWRVFFFAARSSSQSLLFPFFASSFSLFLPFFSFFLFFSKHFFLPQNHNTHTSCST